MKKIFALAMLVLFAMPASADVILSFKDGTNNVWASYYPKGQEYCTRKEFGEYCVQKSDVVSIKEVSAGTKASEYGITSGGDPELIERRREENIEALKSLNCTQLKDVRTRAAQAQYREECSTSEERAAWNEKVRRDNDKIRQLDRELRAQEMARQRESREQLRDSQREWKEQERDRKLDRIDRTLRGW